MSELRFCFVSYEDNEQIEAGDTLSHTWVKPDWPYCVTKYCYFFGSVELDISPSTSPIFEFHNLYIVLWPEMQQVFYEPWTFYYPGPPEMQQIFYEPWGGAPPPFHQVFYEPWSS